MPTNALLWTIACAPLVGSVVAAFLPTNARNAEAWFAAVVAAVTFAAVLALFPAVAADGLVRLTLPWLPQQGLEFTLRMSGLSWLFAALIAGIGVLVVIYARYYLSRDDPAARFFSLLLGFEWAMLGIVLAGNLVQLVFFWELTSLFSFLLIGYWYYDQGARDGARMALTLTAAGGLCLLAGVLLIGRVIGSYDVDVVLGSGSVLREHAWYRGILALVALGALTKSAQFPFHFWLPHAMSAPTPVSAYLHSATMVKAGVYLLALLWPVLAGTRDWNAVIGGVGVATMLVGATFAVAQEDLKGLLAYSTISHLGLITLLLGLGSPLAMVAAIFHLANHATFKASLFMAAGIVDHETGTREMRRLGALRRYMPYTAALATVAALAMAGVPLLNGFLSKEMFFSESIEFHTGSWLDHSLPYVATAWGALSVIYSLRFLRVFYGAAPAEMPGDPHEPPFWMRFPVQVLVLICLLVGVIPAVTIGPVLELAVGAVLGDAVPEYSLRVWHGFTTPLIMSALALVTGVALFTAFRKSFARLTGSPPGLARFDGRVAFEYVLVTLSWRWARLAEALAGTHRLQPQLRLLVACAVAAAAVPLVVHGIGTLPAPPTPFDWGFAVLWTVGAGCAVAVATFAKYHRFAALAVLGGTGIISCLTFVWLSAPDLALTQLLVEIVTVVLLLLGLRWLPKYAREPGRRPLTQQLRRSSDVVLALAAGAGATLFAYLMMARPRTATVGDFFVRNAHEGGGGTNVVNVILVDFRSLDTLGEISVLATVALAVYALLRRFRPAPESLTADYEDAAAAPVLVPALITRAMFPVLGIIATYLFVRGHDLPGGGFIAGILLSIAFLAQYIAHGTRWVESRLRPYPVRWIGGGLALAVLTGAGSFVFGRPFLTSYATYADLGALGAAPLATAMLFDFGVFATVVGTTTLMLVALGHQSTRAHRPAARAPGSGA